MRCPFQELLMLNPRVRSTANAVPSATTKKVKHEWKRNSDKGCTVGKSVKIHTFAKYNFKNIV
jgi:hypothetical protein